MISKVIGLALMVAGIYFLGQNIVFQAGYAYPWWRDVSAAFSVVALGLGILALFFANGRDKFLGWILIGIGILFVFFSGNVFLRPTSLWQFLVGIGAMTAGYQLMQNGRLNI